VGKVDALEITANGRTIAPIVEPGGESIVRAIDEHEVIVEEWKEFPEAGQDGFPGSEEVQPAGGIQEDFCDQRLGSTRSFWICPRSAELDELAGQIRQVDPRKLARPRNQKGLAAQGLGPEFFSDDQADDEPPTRSLDVRPIVSGSACHAISVRQLRNDLPGAVADNGVCACHVPFSVLAHSDQLAPGDDELACA
jgi:hypothetical protein